MSDGLGTRVPKACRTCAKAKKLMGTANGELKVAQGEILQSSLNRTRCRRLNKECGNQAPGAHRHKSTKSSLQVAVLEEKLDRMTALLATLDRSSHDLQSDYHPSPGQYSTYIEDFSTPSNQEEHILMEVFSKRMLPLFPFVVIPVDMTAEQLHRERPFLYLNISMVACQYAPRQRQITKAVQEYIAKHIVLRGEYSLDLLQGLLVHLAWFISISRQPNRYASNEATSTLDSNLAFQANAKSQGSSQLDAFVQLAVAQVVSLRLNQGLVSLKSLDRPLSYLKATDLNPDQIPERTLEERRAYLGCYYLTLMYRYYTPLLLYGPIRFTKYSQECCQKIQEAAEFPTDSYLVQLVRVMRLTDKIQHTVSVDELDSPAILSAPFGLAINWHQAELQELKGAFCCENPYSSILSFHYDTLEMILYRVALIEDFSDAQYGNTPITQVDLLLGCLQATKSFFKHFYSLPSIYLPFFPFTFWGQFGQAVVTMSRLLLFQGNKLGWDRAYAKNNIDFDQILDELTQKLEGLRPVLSNDWSQSSPEMPEIFGRMMARIKLMKEVHHSRLIAQDKTELQALPEPPDFSFMLNMPIDLFFPYGDYGELPETLH
ncbi:hypothetical protein N7495_003511 [Penicillium taxi]|uniref:uncharacterized protein n=1 Tax=Penicillium taxi TaxID=168475 RepID=UPI002545B9CF|nr:uncharacterized protein N7495_003511 [Penicillium taxi]KAJ5898767.1 hypothetical protein N7495_003511 [Penicillium taxi]